MNSWGIHAEDNWVLMRELIGCLCMH